MPSYDDDAPVSKRSNHEPEKPKSPFKGDRLPSNQPPNYEELQIDEVLDEHIDPRELL